MLEDGYGTSTLGDFNTALTVWLLTTLSKERVYYRDLQHIDKKKKEVKIIGDGACPPSLAGKLGRSSGKARPGERAISDGDHARHVFGPAKEQIKKRLNECGIPFWPHGLVTAHCDIDKLLENWTNEYACPGYGTQPYPALIDFCELTGIQAILP